MSNYVKSTNFATKDTLPPGNPLKIVRGIEIDTEFNNISTAVATKIDIDGTVQPAANLPMNSFKHTSVGAASALTDYARADQVQNSTFQYLSGVSGTNTILASALVAPAAYTAGQAFWFVSAGANTGAVTINVNGLGAKAVTKYGTTALAAGDITASTVTRVVYDGTQFQLDSPNVLAAGLARLDAPQTFTATQVADNGTAAVSTTSTYTFDGADQIRTVTFTNAITVTFGAPSGVTQNAYYTFRLLAGDTAARTFAWNSAYKFPAATSPLTTGTATNGASDIITFIGGASNTLLYVGHQADVR